MRRTRLVEADRPQPPSAPAVAGSGAGRRDRNRQRTRKALADAAVHLVAEHGYQHVTVEMIADAAGVSPRTFSNYFAGKGEAVLWVQLEPADGFAEALAAQPADRPLGAALRDALRLVALGARDFAPEMELRMQVLRQEPQLMPAFHARFERVEQTVTAWIAARLGARRADRRPELLALCVIAVIRTSIGKCRSGGDFRRLPEYVDDAFLLLPSLTDLLQTPDPHHR